MNKTLHIKVKPSSPRPGVEESDGEYLVRVKAPAREGEANQEARKLLAGHFGVGLNAVTITRGGRAREKTVTIKLKEQAKKPQGGSHG